MTPGPAAAYSGAAVVGCDPEEGTPVEDVRHSKKKDTARAVIPDEQREDVAELDARLEEVIRLVDNLVDAQVMGASDDELVEHAKRIGNAGAKKRIALRRVADHDIALGV